jgi:hypothetical protein
MSVERNNKVVKKCLDVYGHRKSIRFVQKFFDRVEGPTGSFELYDRVMTEIKQQYLPDFTVYGFVEECLKLYREHTSLEGIYELARSETPMTEDEYREWETRFSDLVKNEPNPPTGDQWGSLADSLLQ